MSSGPPAWQVCAASLNLVVTGTSVPEVGHCLCLLEMGLEVSLAACLYPCTHPSTMKKWNFMVQCTLHQCIPLTQQQHSRPSVQALRAALLSVIRSQHAMSVIRSQHAM